MIEILIPALFLFLGFTLITLQMVREYYWMRSLGGIGSLFDIEEI
jgi:hypothetical protein